MILIQQFKKNITYPKSQLINRPHYRKVFDIIHDKKYFRN